MTLNLVYIIFSSVIAILSLMLFAECLSAFIYRHETPTSLPESKSIAFLVPAKDEEQVIEDTLNSIVPQLRRNCDRLIVIADRCEDDTVKNAQDVDSIVEVIERDEPNKDLWGKGYALATGVEFLENGQKKPPEIVIIIDADCSVVPGTITKLANFAKAKNKPVQITYLMEPEETNHSIKSKISMFALIVKNLVRPLGLSQLGLPCLLNGSGMAFPWSIIREAPLATDNKVEDLKLGIDLAADYSHFPIYLHYDPQNDQRGAIQGRFRSKAKKRWTTGFVQTLLVESPRLLIQSLMQRRIELLFLALELSIPPLTILFALWFIGIIGALVLVLFLQMHLWVPLGILSFSGGLIFTAILLAWWKFGREKLPWKTVISLPFS